MGGGDLRTFYSRIFFPNVSNRKIRKFGGSTKKKELLPAAHHILAGVAERVLPE